MDITWSEAPYGGANLAEVAVNFATFLKVPGARP